MAKKRFEGQFVWNTYGDWIASLLDGNLWDLQGNWIGWVEEDEQVYTVEGEWIGEMNKDGRILRKRTEFRRDLNPNIPTRPEKPDLPARATLPPTFTGLPYSIVDVLEEDPETFKHISDLRPDMD